MHGTMAEQYERDERVDERRHRHELQCTDGDGGYDVLPSDI